MRPNVYPLYALESPVGLAEIRRHLIERVRPPLVGIYIA